MLLLSGIVAIHTAAALCVSLLIGAAYGAALGALVFALGITSARNRAILRGTHALRSLRILGRNDIELEYSHGRTVYGQVADRRHVCRFWVALSVQTGTSQAVVLAGDMLEPEHFRTLRLWALWGTTPGMAGVNVQR